MIDAFITITREVMINRPEALNAMWVFIAGSTVALLRSLVDGSRRTVSRLFLACIFGGLGAMAADRVFHDSEWHIFWVGAAAIITENLIIGLFNASSQFRENPIPVFKDLLGFIWPKINNSSNKDKDRDS